MQNPFSESALVYIVDDEPSVRRALGRLLRSFGLETREFASGPELLAAERCAEPACVVVDVHMPQMDGYELAQHLEIAAPGSRVLLITGHAEELDRWRKKTPSAVTLLLKPISEHELIAAVRQALPQQIPVDKAMR